MVRTGVLLQAFGLDGCSPVQGMGECLFFPVLLSLLLLLLVHYFYCFIILHVFSDFLNMLGVG